MDQTERRAHYAQRQRPFDAYYYGFSSTGVIEIDRILMAVAWAGKGCHHTEHWGEYGYPEDIQDEADAAAQAFRVRPLPDAERLAKRIARHVTGEYEDDVVLVTALLREEGVAE